MEYSTVLIVLALVFGFYMAWNIGANDVANAMGTSVGSGALTFKRAVILAAFLEFAGAFFVGSHVSDTVRKGIVDPVIFSGDPQSFVLGMLSALLAAGVWLQIASYFGWPVSTTHSIVGAIVVFGVL
jgi:PiT family inorganic phosphate transporter